MTDSILRLGTALAQFLEREAGYELISVGLIVTGMAVMNPDAQARAAHDLVVFGLGVLARSMGVRRAAAA